MRRKITYIVWALLLAMMSCQDKNINVFDKTADQRAAEAIASLKADLTAPSHGWRVKYNPESGGGSFYVLLDFKEDNTVNIKTDLNANDGEFFDETITYRIDNSLGLELIMESYCFFSYLFEQNEATFPAEFEFIYVNKTPDNDLVFRSKSDGLDSNATILLFEPAGVNDEAFLGQTLSANLNTMASDLNLFSSSIKLTYTNKDLIFYLSLNPSTRNVTISTASKKSNTQTTKAVDFESGYVIRGDSLVFNSRLSGSFLGLNISINGLKLNSLSDSEIDLCVDPIPVHTYNGFTSSGDAVTLETTIINASGATFAKNEYMSVTIGGIFDNGVSVGSDILNDLPGAVAFQLYYNYDLGSSKLNAIGFVLANDDNSTTFALWEFTPTLVDNNLKFVFKPDVTAFGSPTTADLNYVKKYVEPLADGDNTFVLKVQDGEFELYNPCTGWSAVFFSN